MSIRLPKIIIQNSAFKRIPSSVRSIGSSFIIISDKNLTKESENLLDLMRKKGLKCSALILPAGEQTKVLSTVESVTHSLVKIGANRDSVIIALGGGVIGDLAGFVASIYMRGIPFVSVPTTLLAMCDAGIGGKTGVDLPEGKNMLGTFYQAKMIIIDPLLLKGLPQKAYLGGIAEIVKHAIIADKNLFVTLEKNVSSILHKKPLILKQIIEKNVKIKSNIVKKDEKESVNMKEEKSTRMLLNYGHTVGHAIEKISNYTLPHGEAIAIGMVAENRVAVGKGLLKEMDAERIKRLLQRFGLPIKIPAQYTNQQINKALKSDKKNINGKLYFALPVRIGKAVIKVI